jgi:hypothetical protein
MIKRPNLKIHGVEEGTGIQGLKKHEWNYTLEKF